jgi:subtilisin family serine protease/alpha-tubulin suppressor-like RCC1 family protein
MRSVQLSRTQWAGSVLLLLMAGCGSWWVRPRESASPAMVLEKRTVSARAQIPAEPQPWSSVLPPERGVNPVPEGFVETAGFEDVPTLSYPSPAPVAAGQRARVRLGEMSGAAERHRLVRIEELADVSANRLVERRVMAADHVVLSLQPGTEERALHAALPPDCKVIRKTLTPGRYLVRIPARTAADLPDAILRLARLAVTDGVAPDGYVFSTATPNDPLFPQQYGHGLTTAWDHSTGTTLAPVAVIDSGVMTTHPDLAANIWTNPGESGGGKETNLLDDDGNGLVDDVRGWDFVNDDNLPADDFGHGTHVAGIIAARGNNGQGIAGVNWTGSLVCLKALRSNGSGLWSDVLDAVTYTKAKNINIANLSLGAYGAAPAGVEAVFAGAPGVLFCAAAGNGSLASSGQRIGDDLDQTPFVPATLGLGNVVSVMAHDPAFLPAPFSNYGKVTVDLAAPGVGILSTTSDGGYGLKSGTSMAAAFVSGCAALCQTRERHTPLRLRQMLQSINLSDARTAPGQPTNWSATYCASGRVNPYYCALQGKFITPWRRLAASGSGTSSDSTMSHLTPDSMLHTWKTGSYNATLSAISVADESQCFIAENLTATGYGSHFLNTAPAVSRKGTVDVQGGAASSSANNPSATILLKADGTVWSMGAFSTSITGHPANPTALEQIPGLAGIVQILSDHGGVNHFFLRNDGVLLAMGQDSSALGFSGGLAITTPTEVPRLPPVKKVFHISDATLCQLVSGEVTAWGSYVPFLLGLPSTSETGLERARYAAWEGCRDFELDRSGGAIAVRDDGTLIFRAVSPNPTVPQPVTGLPKFHYAPKIRYRFIIGVDAVGAVWEWGANRCYFGEAGESFYQSNVPVCVPLRSAALDVSVSVRSATGTALLSDGRTQTWGGTGNDALRNGISSELKVPVERPEFRGAAGIAATSTHATLAWWADGTIRSFGVLNPLQSTRVTPLTLPSLTNIKDIVFCLTNPTEPSTNSPGVDRLAALKNDGTIWFFNLTSHFSALQSIGSSTQTWIQPLLLPNPATGIALLRPAGPLQSTTFEQRNLVCLTTLGQLYTIDTSATILPAWRPITGTWPTGTYPMKHLTHAVGSSLSASVTVIGNNQRPVYANITLPATGSATFLVAHYMTTIPANVSPMIPMYPFLQRADKEVYELYYANPAPAFRTTDFRVTTQLPNGQGTVVSVSPTVLAGELLSQLPGSPSTSQSTVVLREDGRIAVDGQYLRGGAPGLWDFQLIPTVADATKLWIGYNGVFFRRTDGSIWAWGDNTTGKLGGAAYSQPAETLNYNISTEVQANGLDLNNWLYTHFSNNELGSINISGDEADPDRDGLTNLEEYALGTDPKAPSDQQGDPIGLTPSFQTVSSESLSMEVGSSGASQGTCYFTVTLKRRARRPGIEYQVLFSDDLQTWSGGPTRLIKVLESEKTVIYRDVVPLDAVARRSAKLVIRKGN